VIGGQAHEMKAIPGGNELLVMMSIAVMCAQVAWPQNAKDAPAGKWKLKHSCDELRLEPAALVIVRRKPGFMSSSECKGAASEAERAEQDYEQSHPESIPLGSITAIVKEVVTRRPVEQAIQDTASSSDPENIATSAIEPLQPEAAALALPLYPVVMGSVVGAMEPFRGVKTHAETVRVLWMENGIPRSINFSLARGDLKSLLNHLADATGKGWTSIRFDSEGQDRHASEVRVHFDRPVSAMNVTVGAATYRLLTLKSPDSVRLIYLLSEDQKDVITGFTAVASPLGSQLPWKLKLARAAEGSWCLTELDTDIERLQLRACAK